MNRESVRDVSFYSDGDRLGIYGTSFGGANGVWVAAHDERVKCLVTSVAVTNGAGWMRLIRRPWEWLAFRERVANEARQRVASGKPTLVPNGDIMIRDPDAQRQRAMHAERGHTFQSEERDLESGEAVMRYRPEWVVDKISPRPVLMIYFEYDTVDAVQRPRQAVRESPTHRTPCSCPAQPGGRVKKSKACASSWLRCQHH